MKERSCVFCDIDGIVCRHGQNDFIPGAIDLLKRLQAFGCQIILTTGRGDNFSDKSVYCRKSTEEMLIKLKEQGVFIKEIIYNVASPRIVINDSGADSINRETNKPWEEKDIESVLGVLREYNKE